MDNQTTPVNFNVDAVKTYLKESLGVPEKYLAGLILPEVGSHFTIDQTVYKVIYIRGNPFRITAEPVGVLEPKDAPKK